MKTTYLLLSALILTGSVYAELRTWTRADGKTADLELIGTTGEGDAIKGQFKMKNGRTVDIPAADLADADAELMKDWKPDEASTAASASGAVSVFDEVLEGQLVKLSGESLKRHSLEQKPTKYYLFYYTASWCPPCQKFTPNLVEFYNTHKPESGEFEIILVTSDRDEDAMEEYAVDKKMEWPHLKLSKVERFKKKFQHPGSGIPNLVLTDLEGNLLATSYEGKQYMGPSVVMKHLGDLLKK